jgi:hypothetical protein
METMEETKVCSVCGEEKVLSEFASNKTNPHAKQGVTSQCKKCMYARRGTSGILRKARGKKRSRARAGGLTQGQFLARCDSQGGVCMICGEEPDRTLNVDHDHETGKVRDLLCQACNLGLGWFEDSPSKLKLAIEYLNRHGKI